jgi:ferredoxin
MVIHYGYEDGSGAYYVSIDAEKCDACNACVEQCPEKAIAVGTVMIDIEDKQVAVVDEAQRKRIKYSCAACHQKSDIRCVRACSKGAIATTWKPRQA